jgi:hypothetical protein
MFVAGNCFDKRPALSGRIQELRLSVLIDHDPVPCERRKLYSRPTRLPVRENSRDLLARFRAGRRRLQ